MDLMDAEGARTRMTRSMACFLGFYPGDGLRCGCGEVPFSSEREAFVRFFPVMTVKKSYEIHNVLVKQANPRLSEPIGFVF